MLAYHAAVLETSLKKDGSHPPFLVLDTPKQHELHAKDLSSFVKRFEEMATQQKKTVQLIIGATEEDFASRNSSSVFWRPAFGTVEKPRFFGVAGSEFEEPTTKLPNPEKKPDPKSDAPKPSS